MANGLHLLLATITLSGCAADSSDRSDGAETIVQPDAGVEGGSVSDGGTAPGPFSFAGLRVCQTGLPNAEAGNYPRSEQVRWTFTGTVTDRTAGISCAGSIGSGDGWTVHLDTEAYGPVTLGVQLRDDQDRTPDLGLELGKRVSAVVVQGATFGVDLGLALSDSAGFLGAFEEGRQGDEPSEAERGGVKISGGEYTGGANEVMCGTQVDRKLDFVLGTERASLASGAQSILTSPNGVGLTVMNVAAYDYEDVKCTDVWGPRSWAIWRAP